MRCSKLTYVPVPRDHSILPCCAVRCFTLRCVSITCAFRATRQPARCIHAPPTRTEAGAWKLARCRSVVRAGSFSHGALCAQVPRATDTRALIRPDAERVALSLTQGTAPSAVQRTRPPSPPVGGFASLTQLGARPAWLGWSANPSSLTSLKPTTPPRGTQHIVLAPGPHKRTYRPVPSNPLRLHLQPCTHNAPASTFPYTARLGAAQEALTASTRAKCGCIAHSCTAAPSAASPL